MQGAADRVGPVGAFRFDESVGCCTAVTCYMGCGVRGSGSQGGALGWCSGLDSTVFNRRASRGLLKGLSGNVWAC